MNHFVQVLQPPPYVPPTEQNFFFPSKSDCGKEREDYLSNAIRFCCLDLHSTWTFLSQLHILWFLFSRRGRRELCKERGRGVVGPPRLTRRGKGGGGRGGMQSTATQNKKYTTADCNTQR